jgi:hypothetical protein
MPNNRFLVLENVRRRGGGGAGGGWGGGGGGGGGGGELRGFSFGCAFGRGLGFSLG